VIPYVDTEGVTVLVDHEALARRRASGAEATLLDGVNRHDLIAFGTHAGGEALAILSLFPFDGADLLKHRVKSTFDAGLLRTGGRVVLCDRAQLARGDEPRVHRVPAGLYRVLVHRSLSHDPSQDDGVRPIINLVHLARVEDGTTVPAFTVVPGSDGYPA
jgi:hypothetical protein